MEKIQSASLDIQSILQEYIEDNAGVGAAIGYIDNGVIQYYVSGKKEFDSNALIDTESIFAIGSITKVFTIIALMEMVKQGKAHLDDPIENFLPEVKVPEKNGKKITLWHLATHSSGLPRMPDNFKPKNPENPYADYTAENLYTFLSNHTLTKNPGEQHEYSNLGVGLLGFILCLIEKTDYDMLIKKYICDPLGMQNSTAQLTPSMRNNQAYGHSMLKKVNDWDLLDTTVGAGAIKSTITDMTRFLATNMGLIDTTLHQSMQACHAEQCSTSSGHEQCFGWLSFKTNNNTILWHDGGTGGYRSFIGFDKKNKKGVVILSNAANCAADPLGFHILDPMTYKLEKLVFNKSLATPKYLSTFVGVYELQPNKYSSEPYIFTINLIDNKLLGEMGHFLPDTNNIFRIKGRPESYKVNVIMNDQQEIIELQFVQPGGIFKALPKK